MTARGGKKRASTLFRDGVSVTVRRDLNTRDLCVVSEGEFLFFRSKESIETQSERSAEALIERRLS